VFGNPLRWDDLGWLRSLTKLPMLLKGIQHPDDVRKARDRGIDGIYCSNHGGRQANGGLPSLEALPAGALRLGCAQRFRRRQGLGRTYLYALAIGGVDGLVSQLRAVLAELDLLMAVDGKPSIADLRAAGVQRI